MSTRDQPLMLQQGILLVGMFGCLCFGIAEAQPPSSSDVDGESQEQENLDVRYARAHLRLAKLDLRRFMEEQRRQPNLLPLKAAEELERHVEIDEEQLKQALKGPNADMHQIYIRSAKIALELAEKDLKRKRKANEEFPSKIQEMEVDRAEAVLEVVKTHLAITNAKQSSLSTMMYMQWQIDVLRNQVQELQLQVRTNKDQ